MSDGAAAAAAGGDTGGQQQQQQQQKPWHDGMDGTLLGHAQNKGWKLDDPRAAFEAAAKSSFELQKHFGAPAEQILRLPKDQADEAGWSAVRQRLGMPKEAKEYDFSAVKFADGTELEQGFTDQMRSALHRAGVARDSAPEVVKAVVKFMDDADAAETAARTATLQTERAALQREWGSNFEMNKLTAMQGAKRALGGDDAKAAEVISAMETAIGHKATMEFWRKIGAGTSEDTFHEGGGGGNPVTMNGARARREELMADPDWSARYLKGSPKEVAEMNSLMQLIAGAAA